MEFMRMLDKEHMPSEGEIQRYMGAEAHERLCRFEKTLQGLYALNKELRFPFGNHYGWGYKYSHNKKHLCYAFFENGAFVMMAQIGDKNADEMEQNLVQMLEETRRLWEKRYPCGERGGWVHYRIASDAQMKDAITMLTIRQKPAVARGR